MLSDSDGDMDNSSESDNETTEKVPNFLFYSGKIPSIPDGKFIQEFHNDCYDFHSLEYHHGFIQWLFPIFESSGANWYAQPLSKLEAKMIREDFTLSTRVIKSYRLMLKFYGMELVSEKSGEIQHSSGNWQERYDNLNWSGHNNLRISRILTSLGELGFSRYKKPWIDFLKKEILENKELQNCRSSLIKFWVETLNVDSKSYIKKNKRNTRR